jgi:hypothetical protein
MAGEVLASFPPRDSDPWPEDNGLSLARDWARRTLAAHPLAVTVEITEQHQAYAGTSWTQGPGVETVRRDETATPEPVAGVTQHDHYTVRQVVTGLTREGQLPHWYVAAENPRGGWITWTVVRERGRLLFTSPFRFERGDRDDNRASALAYLAGDLDLRDYQG